jgi:hypothetical protein
MDVKLATPPLFLHWYTPSGLFYQSLMISEHEAFSGMKIGKGHLSARKKAVQATLCKPQIPHDLTWKGRDISQAVSRRLPTAAARDRPQFRSCGICGGQSGFSPCISVSPANSHSTDCSTITIIYNTTQVQ